MKEKIFSKLKTTYAHLGLGDDVLQAHAEGLSLLGYVTDENIDSVVSGQKSYLENLQKISDKRVTDAIKKSEDNLKKKLEEEAKRKLEEEEKARKEKEQQEKAREMPEWFKAEKEASEKKFNEMLETLNGFKQENEKLKSERAAQERKNLIVTKAKELGIPQYRIDEGFSISEDADENTISEYLSKVSSNIKSQQLPSSRVVFPLSDDKPDKAEIDSIAKSLLG